MGERDQILDVSHDSEILKRSENSETALNEALDLLLDRIKNHEILAEVRKEIIETLPFKTNEERQQHLMAIFRFTTHDDLRDPYYRDWLTENEGNQIEDAYQHLLSKNKGEFSTWKDSSLRVNVEILRHIQSQLGLVNPRIIETHSVGDPAAILSSPRGEVVSLSLESHLSGWSFFGMSTAVFEKLGLSVIGEMSPANLDRRTMKKIGTVFNRLFPNQTNLNIKDGDYDAESKFDIGILRNIISIHKQEEGYPTVMEATKKGIGHFVKIGGYVVLMDMHHSLSGASSGARNYGSFSDEGNYQEVFVEGLSNFTDIKILDKSIPCVAVKVLKRVD